MDELNHAKLSEIPEKGKLYKAKDRGRSPFLETLQTNCPVPAGTEISTKFPLLSTRLKPSSKELKLKVGAQVLLLKNISIQKGFVNGNNHLVALVV